MKRDSSPPDAIRVSGAERRPGLVETSNSTRSVPDGPGSAAAMRGAEARGVELERRKLGRDRRVEARRGFAPLAAQRRRRGGIGLARRDKLPVELGDPLAAGLDRRELLAHLRRRAPRAASGSTRCLRARPRMSNSRASACSSRAGSNASASAARAIRSSASLASISARSSAASASASKRMVGRAALDPPRRLAQLGERAVRSAEQLVEAGQRFARLERRPASPRAPRQGAFPRLPRAPAPRSRALACSSHSRSRSAAAALGARLDQLGLDPRHLRPRALDRAPCRSCRRRRARRDGPWG